MRFCTKKLQFEGSNTFSCSQQQPEDIRDEKCPNNNRLRWIQWEKTHGNPGAMDPVSYLEVERYAQNPGENSKMTTWGSSSSSMPGLFFFTRVDVTCVLRKGSQAYHIFISSLSTVSYRTVREYPNVDTFRMFLEDDVKAIPSEKLGSWGVQKLLCRWVREFFEA